MEGATGWPTVTPSLNIKCDRTRLQRALRKSYLPVIASGRPGHLAEVFIAHPLVLGELADAAGGTLDGGAATDGVLVLETVERAMDATGRGRRRGLLGTLGGTQGGRDIERRLGRAQLTGGEREILLTGRGGRVVGGRGGGGVDGGRMAVDGDLVRGCGGEDVSGHIERRGDKSMS